MTRQIEVHGKRITLYRVDGYENAWCSDPRLAAIIERRRKEIERQLQAAIERNRAVERGEDPEEMEPGESQE